MLDEENISKHYDDARIAERPRRLLMVFIRRYRSVLRTQRKAVEKWEIRPLQYAKAKRHMVIEKIPRPVNRNISEMRENCCTKFRSFV